MKRKWIIVALMGLMFVMATGNVFAWSGKEDVDGNLDGKPEQFQSRGAKGYYIWQDDYGLHIWTTTCGEEHVFSGSVRTDGKFYQVRGHRLEDGDSFTVYGDIQEKFWFKFMDNDTLSQFSFGGREVNVGNDTIRFKFDDVGGADGLNFHVKDASYLQFSLFEDGHPVPQREIHISYNGWHPFNNVFKVYH